MFLKQLAAWAAVGVALALACPALATERAATPATFASVLNASAAGDVINLGAGSYTWTISGKSFATPLVIKPADGVDRADVSGRIVVSGSTGVTFRGVTVGRYNPITTSTNIIVEDCRVWSDGSAGAQQGFDINTTNGLTIRRCIFDGGIYAIAIAQGMSNVTIEDNEFLNFTVDVVRGSLSGATNVMIQRNYFHSMGGDVDAHRDSIQLWGGSAGTITNLTIQLNVLDYRDGVAIQGINLSDDGPGAGFGYTNLVVHRNAVIGAANHGFDIIRGINATVTDNFTQGGYGGFNAWFTQSGNTYAAHARNWSSGNDDNDTDPNSRYYPIPQMSGASDNTYYDLWRAQFGVKGRGAGRLRF